MDNRLAASVTMIDQRLARKQIRGCTRTILLKGKRVSVHQGEASTLFHAFRQVQLRFEMGSPQRYQAINQAFHEAGQRLARRDLDREIAKQALEEIKRDDTDPERKKLIAERALGIMDVG